MDKNEKKEKFAVIKIGGTQLKVVEGSEYEINKMEGKKGDKIEVNEVMLFADGSDVKVGEPYVEGSKVTLEITSQKKDKKVDVFKYKAKSRYRKSLGHRSLITKVLVKKIV